MNKWIFLLAAIWATFPAYTQTARGVVSPLWEQPVQRSFKVLPNPDMIIRLEPGQEDTGFWTSVLDDRKKSKTVVFHFKNISTEFELNYKDNARMMAILDSIFSDFSILDEVEFITITGASSPDGYTERNEKLAADRAKVLRTYLLRKYPYLDINRIRSLSAGQYWQGLQQLVERDRLTPSRDAALRIIKSPQSGDVRRRQLQQLSSRKTYNYLLNNTFPHLRVCAVHIVFSDNATLEDREVFTGEVLSDEVVDIPRRRETQQTRVTEQNIVRDPGEYTVVPERNIVREPAGYTVIPEPGTKYTVIPNPGAGVTVIPEPGTKYTVIPRHGKDVVVPTERIPDRTQPVRETQRATPPRRTARYEDDMRPERIALAMKTNLLFDVATAVNFELEVPIADNWSLAAEYIFPWWLLKEKQYCLQLIAGNLEMRYWTGDRTNRPKMTGFFGGFFIGGGYYDLEFGDKGYQGEINIMTGLSGGYAHEISRDGKWRMEYSLGLGYMSTDYREYKPTIGFDNELHLIVQKSSRQAYYGPLRAKISLVRTINRK